MKSVLASLVAVCLVAGSASAQQAQRPAGPLPTTANVPTGNQVPGCADYRLVDGAVVQTCAQSPSRMLQDYREARPTLRGFATGAGGGAS